MLQNALVLKPSLMLQNMQSQALPPLLQANSNHQNDVYHTADHVTETFNFCDPIIFQAMTKKKDPDLPTYHEALTGYDHEGFCKAMGKEICELDSKNMWTICKCSKMNQQN